VVSASARVASGRYDDVLARAPAPGVEAIDLPSTGPLAPPGRRWIEPGVVVALALAGAGIAVATQDVGAATGAVALGALGVASLRARSGQPVLAGQVLPLAAGVAVLTLARAGIGTPDGASWHPLAALVAYPFLGRAVLRLLADCRRVREVDVLVEGALVGVAAAIVVQIVMADWRAPALTPTLLDARGAVPAVLIGLDVALVVVGARAFVSPVARRGPLALVLAGVGVLLVAHASQAVRPFDDLGGFVASLAAAGIACIGLAGLHPRAAAEPDVPAEEPPLFSATHAGLVVVALAAAPVALAVQAIREVTASPAVATGAVISGAILACYLVGLLQERATTEHRATHDGLTELPNRALFADRLERAIAHGRRTDRPVAVLFIDLDRFKEVNDTFGHAAGDVLLRTVAARLLTCCREEDTVARLAGDEFAVLLPYPAAGGDAVVVAQRILDVLAEPVTLAGERIPIGGSIGIAVYPEDGSSTDELLASADAAMYRAKDNGGNGYELFNPQLATQAHERLRLEAALYDGVERDELVLHYQPIVDLPSRRTVGAEALVRWEHPERGLLLPGHFVPVAERSDLVVLLGERVILDACRELRRWHDLGLGDRFISVNVSSRHFSHGLVSTIAAALRETGADPRRLVVELTESTAAENLAAVAGVLDELRELGVRSAIDDFGTGYCGLRYLGSLPVDALKVDKSFVQGMTPSDAAIVAATIAMGHSLGLTLVAEGVETVEQRRFLEAQRCDRIQGYLVGRPMPATDLVDRLRAEDLERQAAAPAYESSFSLMTARHDSSADHSRGVIGTGTVS